MSQDVSHNTRLLKRSVEGEPAAAEELFSKVYERLRGIARRLVQGPSHGQTLQPTELIHEAYVRLIDGSAREFQDEVHFTRVAARAMRYVLVDRARARLADKRGGARHRVTLDTKLAVIANDADDLMFVHDGLERLAEFDEQLGEIVEMRFFGGMKMEAIADALGISLSSVNRAWRLARAWWIREFGDTIDSVPDDPGGDA